MTPIEWALIATIGMILCGLGILWLLADGDLDVKVHPEVLDEMSSEWRTAQQRHRSQELHGLVKLSDRRGQ